MHQEFSVQEEIDLNTAMQKMNSLLLKHGTEEYLPYAGVTVLKVERKRMRDFMQDVFADNDLAELSDGVLSDATKGRLPERSFCNWAARIGVTRERHRLCRNGHRQDTTNQGPKSKRYRKHG